MPRERRVVESAAAELNGYLDLPYEITLFGRSCAGGGSACDPGARLIELCYEDLTEQRELFETARRRPAGEEAAAVMVETVFYEAGHALADVLDLRSDDDRAEEDAADALAASMLIGEGAPSERTLLTAAQAYELAAAHTGPDLGTDEHAPTASARHFPSATRLCPDTFAIMREGALAAGQALQLRGRTAGHGGGVVLRAQRLSTTAPRTCGRYGISV
ncbi:DUF4344 domain-containing metallopeptidase [Streptomyces goshikiensis]|uniref:DUF4344 domain-containing metallopeptidase n=1 Tax=Streptomyces goshikiensis TaxID=1942 RepID=UPI00364ABC03